MSVLIHEATRIVDEGLASAEDVDSACVNAFGHRMGPLETADLIGLDTVLLSLQVLYDYLEDSKFQPCPLLVEMVESGRLGRKAGEGFFRYAVS